MNNKKIRKNLKMTKLFIFDLDNTLLLWKVTSNYKLEYEHKLKTFLKKLKKNNYILAIASHNTSPRYYLRKMSIDGYFDYIIGEYPRSKYCMILEILNNINNNIKKDDIIFFDDLDSNIEECKKNGIISIKVDPKKGIEFDNLINLL
jgi:HAD superfamily phosphatase (TIGR01681 family)